MTEDKRANVSSNYCVECGGPILWDLRGDLLCTQCGLILEESMIDYTTNSPRYHDEHEKNARARSGFSHKFFAMSSGYNTQISRDKRFYSSSALKRMVRLDKQSENVYIVYAVHRLIRFIKKTCAALKIPKFIRDESTRAMKRYKTTHYLNGRSLHDISLCHIYHLCHEFKFPVFFDEIAMFSNNSEKQLRSVFRRLILEDDLEYSIIDPLVFLPRALSELGLEQNLEREIRETYLKINQSRFVGKNPLGILAGVVYLKTDRIQSEISEVFHVTPRTLRARIRELKNQ